MIKLFISQPMRGKTDKQILDEREAAVQKTGHCEKQRNHPHLG